MTRDPSQHENPASGPPPTGEPAASDAYRELFVRSADAILIIEGETFIDCNDAAVRMLRHANREAVLRTHPSQLSPPTQPDGRDSYEKANEMIALASERGSHRFEWDHLRADGEVFPVEVLLTSVQEPDRRVLHVVWRDITERKALEGRLRHVLKMEALGKLAGGIAHDFNNLLVVVQGHADLLRHQLDENARALGHLAQIKEAGDKAAQLVQQLLAFGRKQEIAPRVLDLRGIVHDAISLVKPLVGDDVELSVDWRGAPIHVKVDEGQVEQVLLNLAANARDAMPRGGRLTVSIDTIDIDEGSGSTVPGCYGRVMLSDTGTGMSEETLSRAFDPFFTTKQVGEGTGLGLASVYGIVSQCGGEVRLSSELGSGTTVELYLPLTDESPAPAQPQSTSEPAAGGSETILVVEDQPIVAAVVALALREAGYTVLQAGDGVEGLERFEEHADSIALVLTDVMMPRMNGVEFVSALSQAGHDLPVLFMSGYTNNALANLTGFDRPVDLIQKPFEIAELLRRLRKALAQGA